MFILFCSQQRRGSDAKEDSSDKPRRNVSWQDKSKSHKDRGLMPRGTSSASITFRTEAKIPFDSDSQTSWCVCVCVCVCLDPVVVPVESEEEKGEHSDPEKEEDIGITFVARKAETPKQRPKSGRNTHTLTHTHIDCPLTL